MRSLRRYAISINKKPHRPSVVSIFNFEECVSVRGF